MKVVAQYKKVIASVIVAAGVLLLIVWVVSMRLDKSTLTEQIEQQQPGFIENKQIEMKQLQEGFDQKSSSDKAATLVILAYDYERIGQLDDAITTAKEAIELDEPANFRLYTYIGDLYKRKDSTSNARLYYETSLRKIEQYAEAAEKTALQQVVQERLSQL